MKLAKIVAAVLGTRYLHKARFGRGVNVNRPERWLSTLLGVAFSGLALKRGRGLFGRLGAATLGGMFARRGLTGRCNVYRKLGVSSS